MKYLFYSIFITFIIYTELTSGKPSKPRQFNGISFAIPALNFLQGGNAGATGGNVFRQATVTRTIIRTVSTIAQGVPRTCTATLPAAAGFPACPGRRRRSAGPNDENENTPELKNGMVIPTEPSILVVIGTTSITNQMDVSKLLNLSPTHENDPITKIRHILNDEEDITTKLYPSQDTLDAENDDVYSRLTEVEGYGVSNLQNFESDNSISRAGLNFAGTTTITSTISITAVTTSYISGPSSVTLTVMYTGCSPTSFPVTGTPC